MTLLELLFNILWEDCKSNVSHCLKKNYFQNYLISFVRIILGEPQGKLFPFHRWYNYLMFYFSLFSQTNHEFCITWWMKTCCDLLRGSAVIFQLQELKLLRCNFCQDSTWREWFLSLSAIKKWKTSFLYFGKEKNKKKVKEQKSWTFGNILDSTKKDNFLTLWAQKKGTFEFWKKFFFFSAR